MLERRINIVRHRKYSIAFKRDIGIKNRIVVSHAITKVPNPFHCGANFATTSGIRERALQTEAPELVVAFPSIRVQNPKCKFAVICSRESRWWGLNPSLVSSTLSRTPSPIKGFRENIHGTEPASCSKCSLRALSMTFLSPTSKWASNSRPAEATSPAQR